MYQGVDSRGVKTYKGRKVLSVCWLVAGYDLQPKEGSSPAAALFFIVFIFVGESYQQMQIPSH